MNLNIKIEFNATIFKDYAIILLILFTDGIITMNEYIYKILITNLIFIQKSNHLLTMKKKNYKK